MASHLANPIDQENTTSTSLAKSADLGNKEQPMRRGALGDLGNTIHELNNANNMLEANRMGPPLAMAKKVVEVTEKASFAKAKAKVNNVTIRDKENLIKKDCKIPTKRTVQPSQPIKKEGETSKINVAEQAKALNLYDPDEDTRDNAQMVTEYIPDILMHLRSIEDEFPIKENFLDGAKVSSQMRATLVNWLVEVHQNFDMKPETLHLCVSIVDRYLQVNKLVARSIFQLVGTAALLLAGKYEEIYVPGLEDFVYICDDTFTKKQILQMEMDISKKLDFRFGWPLSIYFLRRFSKIACVKRSQHNLAKYLLELALLEYNMSHIKPSMQAAAACCLAIAIIDEVPEPSRVWTPTLMQYTKYKYSNFKGVVHKFAQIIVKAKTTEFRAVRQKYSQSTYGKISVNFKLAGMVVRKLVTNSTVKFR